MLLRFQKLTVLPYYHCSIKNRHSVRAFSRTEYLFPLFMKKTINYQYRVAPGTTMIDNRDYDTPAQPQIAGNKGNSEKNSKRLEYLCC